MILQIQIVFGVIKATKTKKSPYRDFFYWLNGFDLATGFANLISVLKRSLSKL